MHLKNHGLDKLCNINRMQVADQGIIFDIQNIGIPVEIEHVIGAPADGDYDWVGMLSGMSTKDYRELDRLQKGIARIKYIKDKSKVLKRPNYIFRNERENMVAIVDIEAGTELGPKINAIHQYLPNDAWILVGVRPDGTKVRETISQLEIHGFGGWFLTRSHPLKLDLQGSRIWGARENAVRLIEDEGLLLRDNDQMCEVIVNLDPDTVRELHKYVVSPGKRRDGYEVQRETAGQLEARSCGERRYTLYLKKDSIIKGEVDQVPIAGGVFNFHSHPVSAYIRHHLLLGGPSTQDYVGFLAAVHEYNTIMHMVLAREGIYFIALYPTFIRCIDKINDNFCRRNVERVPAVFPENSEIDRHVASGD